ncbi:MAG: Ig-like domain-containing protein [Alicyclobacillus sp.]|nr:Ig-like domain-containing protein [Alicyclobacillus sp.]
MLKCLKWLRWRRAGGENNVPRLIWIAAAVGLTGAAITGMWVANAYGGHKQAVVADDMANKLWGRHIPSYGVTVGNGTGYVSQTGITGMTVDLTANSQQVFVGQAVTLTAAASEDVSGYELIIFDQTSGQWVGSTVTSGTENTVTVTQTSAGSHTYVAYVGLPDSPADTAAASQPVTVTWAALSISVQASPNTNVFPGQRVTITGRVTSDGNGVPGQTVALTANGGSLSPTQVTTDANGNFTATFTPSAQGTYTITASCVGSTATATIQVRPTFTVSLQANTQTLVEGQSAILTATLNQDVSPFVLDIYDQTTGQLVGSPMSSGTSTVVTVSVPSYGTHTYVASVEDPNNPSTPIAQSSAVTVTWRMKLTIEFNQVPTIYVGQQTTISGTVTHNGQPVPNETVALSVSQGTISAQTVTTNANGQFSVTYTASSTPGTVTVTATSEGQSGTTTFQVIQGATSVTLTATPGSSSEGDTTVKLTATANAPLAPTQTLSILDLTTGQVVGGPTNQQTLTVTVTLPQGATHQFVAQLNG